MVSERIQLQCSDKNYLLQGYNKNNLLYIQRLDILNFEKSKRGEKVYLPLQKKVNDVNKHDLRFLLSNLIFTSFHFITGTKRIILQSQIFLEYRIERGILGF